METTLFGGPPELGNMLKLANGQVGFISIFAHPLFDSVADVIPSMKYACDEIMTNKGVWLTKAEQEKGKQARFKRDLHISDQGNVSPRTRSPIGRKAQSETERAAYFSNSPLRTAFSTLSNGQSAEGEAEGTPRNPSRRSSDLAAVAGVVTPPEDSLSKRLSRSNMPAIPSADGPSASNIQGAVQSAPEIGSHASDENEHPRRRSSADDRRDNAVSMRAGAEILPEAFKQSPEIKPDHSTPSGLSKFTFATSDEREPVRTYDPEQHYPAVHAGARASAPMNDLVHQAQQAEMAEEARHVRSAQSDDNTTSTNLRGGGEELTPSHSTETTSFTTERSGETGRQLRTPDSDQKNRVAGTSLGSPVLNSSMKSADSNQNEITTAAVANGETADMNDRDSKKNQRTMGRRRSKLRLGLAFWKKRPSEKTIGENEEPRNQQAMMSGSGEAGS